jgi:N,N-dimethylformamidase
VRDLRDVRDRSAGGGPVDPEIIGYTDPLAVSPGQEVQLMVSTTAERYRVEVVRLRHGDASARGPGVRWSPAGFGPECSFPGRRQEARPGSFGVAPVGLPPGSVTLQAWVMPTRVDVGRPQVVLRLDSGVGVEIDASGRLNGRLPDSSVVVAPRRLDPWSWLFVALVLDESTGRATLDVREVEWPRRCDEISQDWSGAVPGAGSISVASAAPAAHPTGLARVDGFDGRVESPQVFGAALTAAELDRLAGGGRLEVEPHVRWRFEHDPRLPSVTASGTAGGAMALHQSPQRLVAGRIDRANAEGELPAGALCAVHFHEDDLEDAGWDADLSFVVPVDTPSAVYAVRLVIDGDEDVIPFFVRPAPAASASDVAVLFPTFSYLAYANERLQDAPRDMEPGDERGLPILPDRGDLILRRRRDLGLSTYDTHQDGSGCCTSSARRPILNMRPDHRNWQTHAPRALAADLYLVDWLDELEVSFDAIDDGLLHDEGVELLERYRVLITGAHPEYWSEQMLDALEQFLEGGGRVMYLSGNGLYWVTSVDPLRPHLIEVRRGHNGTRSWEPRPGELRHATTGEVGGLWRYRGRGPNRSVGVGFAGQGYSHKAAPFLRTPDADDERANWMFAGVPEGPIGDTGLIMDGAAGDEFDRADVALGTPPHALVVATSAGLHADSISVVVEDLLIAHPGVSGQRHPLVRSDVVFFETGTGGAVFSGASMGWTGCLSPDGYDNALARLTRNVLERFLDPTPFPVPS